MSLFGFTKLTVLQAKKHRKKKMNDTVFGVFGFTIGRMGFYAKATMKKKLQIRASRCSGVEGRDGFQSSSFYLMNQGREGESNKEMTIKGKEVNGKDSSGKRKQRFTGRDYSGKRNLCRSGALCKITDHTEFILLSSFRNNITDL